MKNSAFTISGRLKSIRFAINGIYIMLASQHNAWIHALATFCVVGLGVYVSLNEFEWIAIVLAIVTVWTTEAVNTAFEFICDVASPDYHPLVKKGKDVAAGAVLISSIGSLMIALIIFFPHFS